MRPTFQLSVTLGSMKGSPSVGMGCQASLGEKKKLQVVLIQSTLNSALFSGGQTYVGGSSEIHWGPVVSYSTASDAIPDPSDWEDFPVYMAKGGILLGKTPASAQGKNCTDPIVGKCVCEYCASLGSQPVVPISTLRSRALGQNSDGLHYKGPSTSPSTFICKAVSPALPALMDDKTVVFYDTADGHAYDPETDSVCKGSYSGGNDRGADIQFTGGCGKGTLIVLGDLTLAGNGSCPSITMKAPANCIGKLEADAAKCVDKSSNKLFWDGFVFIGNDLKSTGTQQIYGSMYAYDTSGVSGNFSIYYRSDNENLGYLGKSLMVKLWLERAPKPEDVFP